MKTPCSGVVPQRRVSPEGVWRPQSASVPAVVARGSTARDRVAILAVMVEASTSSCSSATASMAFGAGGRRWWPWRCVAPSSRERRWGCSVWRCSHG